MAYYRKYLFCHSWLQRVSLRLWVRKTWFQVYSTCLIPGAQAQGGSPEHKRPRLITQMLRPLFTAHSLKHHFPKPELVGQRSILHTRFLCVVSTGLGASPGLCVSVVWSQCQRRLDAESLKPRVRPLRPADCLFLPVPAAGPVLKTFHQGVSKRVTSLPAALLVALSPAEPTTIPIGSQFTLLLQGKFVAEMEVLCPRTQWRHAPRRCFVHDG